MNNQDNNSVDFIRSIVREDLASGKHDQIVTRFPPEPNGHLHIGHATSVCLNFGIGKEAANGYCNLRFDDTNPSRESNAFVEAIKRDIRWLGFDWGDKEFYASDYFQQLYEYAVKLVVSGKAYVDSQSPDEIRESRGTLKEPGQNSPYRDRSIEDNLDLFSRMKSGEFEEASHVLRAKIDMSSPNLNLRDPVMYRILRSHHHQTGTEWPIYPMYDFAHGLSDSIEGVTHSLCTMEYEDHRPLYDWFLDQLGVFPSRQIEFGKVLLSHTILSKRNLLRLVESGHVDGWDDPRMPTLSGMKRLGFTPESIRDFCGRVGITRRSNVADIALLEHCLREDLNKRAERRMAVLNPLKIIITNYPENEVEYLAAVNNPEDMSAGSREIPFSRELYIEREDFMEDPPRKFFRLAPGREIRLRYGFFIKCENVIKDPDTGEISELQCTYDPDTRGGFAPDGRKVRATIHWVSARHALPSEVRLYDRLCSDPNPDIASAQELETVLNPHSLDVIKEAMLEPSLKTACPGEKYQFERLGYFCADSEDSKPGTPVFNRTVTLRDTWARLQKAENKARS
ncbi:MAG: glutamine--tRNA ligase/YqeY domain fusion protein [Chloroflexota bacterium]|jgi:glutaminyl-tRNA synthetase|uniref:glutamine--tRNA ligase n=1 Tax=marine metagenome TaxID=408172 RepID=A0A381USK6_9ZZZZ|nr:glutamine--tRNA ligase/YqeY domain fusion protein [SAR202 cluster bacterium]MEC9320576.1 glutamine--tRNA ligase/YqeY domain fusion protein [Chloroflexota bacterium]|tara:strand:+ start:626 stop:2326 length:1701 start_codon:yes stop_codon:yes gene_type:complete